MTPDRWQLRTKSLPLGRMPLLMGIVNVTPDSFSDGGRFLDPSEAVDHGLRLVAEGADLLDIGGQSTRPGATPVDADDETRRVLPVVAELCRRTATPISIDTFDAGVAASAIAAGAEAINDITALTGDARMTALAASTGCGVVAMHMQGAPGTMQDGPVYGDVVAEVFEYLRERRDALVAAGIHREHIALDPGIGFGKTAQHNLTILSNISRFIELDQPILVGLSRKAFIGHVLEDRATDRTAGTIGAALAVASRGVQILRVHDVAQVRQALLLFRATGGESMK